MFVSKIELNRDLKYKSRIKSFGESWRAFDQLTI